MNSAIILIAAAACLTQSAVYSYVIHPGYYIYGTGLRYPAGVPSVPGAASAVAGTGTSSGAMVAAASGAYHRPLAYPVVLPSGFLLDTPEVAAVKAAHLTALRNTRAAIIRAGVGAGAGAYGSGTGVYGTGVGVYAPSAGVYGAGNYGGGQYAYQG